MSHELDDTQGDEHTREELTFWPAFRRAGVAGLLVAVISIGALAPLAWFLPPLTAHWLLRMAIAFAVAWILFEAIHRAAGMVGWPFSALVGVLTVLIMASHQVIFALHGVPTRDGIVSGWQWLTPVVLLVANIPTLIGMTGCICLRHDGGADLDTLVEILRQGIYGP